MSEVTARLLGASTLVSTPLCFLSVIANRYSVARIPLVMMITYRLLQVSAGLVHYDRFDFSQPTTWNYFGGGTLMMLIMLFGLWRGPHLGKPVDTEPAWLRGTATLHLSTVAANILRGVGTLYIVLGIIFFIMGAQAGWLWFEPAGKLTGLTARLFASPAVGLGLAMWLIPRSTFWREVGVPAIGMATFGVAGSLTMLLGLPDVTPPVITGYLVPLTPLVLLLIGIYLLLPGRARL